MEDIPSFSSKGSAIPRGVDSTAQDANPSEQSGVRLGKPVWRQFVDNEAFQKSSQGAIRSEIQYQRQTALDNRQPDEKWGGDNGRLFRKLGKTIEEHDPEQFADDPVVGPFARKSLWDKELRATRRDAEAFSLLQGDPSFKSRELKDKDREDAMLQAQALPDGDPEKSKAQARLAADDEYRKTKTDLEQKAYDAKARAFALENTHPDQWWQQRRMERKDAVVGEVQTRRAAIDSAEASAMEHKAQLQARKAAGVTGDQVAAIQQEEAEVDSALEQLVAKRVENEGKLEETRRGFIDNTVTALKRGYAGAAQASNILQGATDQTNAEDIVRYDAMKKANPASKEFQDFMAAKGFVESAKAFMSNPVRIITEVMAESAAQMAPSIALGVLGGSVGGAVVAAPTAEAGAPVTVPVGAVIGGAVGAGSGSALAEYGSSMMQAMEEAGMDATKPESIKQFFSDTAKLAKAKDFAVKRGVAVGLFDAVSAGLAGKFMKPVQAAFKGGEKIGAGTVLAASGKEVALQAGTGATGEAAGQLASTGEIKDAKSIFLEGIAEVGSAPFEVASNLRDFSKKPLAPEEVDLVKPDVDQALAALDVEAPPATPEEIKAAQFITRPEDGAAGVAEAVVIGRELGAVENEDDVALAEAQEELDLTLAAGGDAKPAEAKVEIVKKKTGRAPLVKAALKIATGQPMHSLTPTELATLGFKKKGDKISEMSPTELEASGLDKPLAYEGPDKSPILTDEAVKKVGAISATAAGQIKLTEAEALAKATQRVEGASWDVMVDDGSTVRVTAPDALAAELAVAQGGQRIQPGQTKRVANENQGQANPPVQPATPNTGSGAGGGAAKGTGAAEAGKEQVARTVAAVRKKIEIVKKRSPKLASVIEETTDELAVMKDGKILVNPERIVADATKAGMGAGQTIEYFNRVLDEEIRHLAYRNATAGKPDAYFEEMWQREFVATGKDGLVRTAYGKKSPGVFDSLSPRQKLEEAIRLISQGENATEYSALLNKKFGEQFLELLRSVLAELRKLGDSPAIKAEVAKLEAALKVLVGKDVSYEVGDIVTHNGRRAEVIRPVVNGRVALRYGPAEVGVALVGEVVKGEPVADAPKPTPSPKPAPPTGKKPSKKDQDEADENKRKHEEFLAMIENGRKEKPEGFWPEQGNFGIFEAREKWLASKGVLKSQAKMIGRYVEIGDMVEDSLARFNGEVNEFVKDGWELIPNWTESVIKKTINGTVYGYDMEGGVRAIDRSKPFPVSETGYRSMGYGPSGNSNIEDEIIKREKEGAKLLLSETASLAKQKDGSKYSSTDQQLQKVRLAATADQRDKFLKAWEMAARKTIENIRGDKTAGEYGLKMIARLEAGLAALPELRSGDMLAIDRLDRTFDAIRKGKAPLPVAPEPTVPTTTLKFPSRKAAGDWMKQNGLTSGKLTKLDTELFGLEVPKGDYVLPKAWYRFDGTIRFTDAADPDNGFGLEGPYSRNTMAELEGLDPAELKAREKNPRGAPAAPKTSPEPPAPNPNPEPTWPKDQKEKEKAASQSAETPKLTPAEQALKDLFNELGEGLESAPIVPTDFYASKGIPDEKVAMFLTVAKQLHGEGVTTPEALARVLDKIGGGKLRAYSEAVWSLLRVKVPSLPQSGDWGGVYSGIDKPAAEEKAPEKLMDIPESMTLLHGLSLSKTDEEAAWKLILRTEATLRKEGKIQGARGFFESDIMSAVEEILSKKNDSAAFRKRIESARKNRASNPELDRLVGLLESEESVLLSIESDRGMYGVKWAEKNVRSRATAKKAEIRKLKERIVAMGDIQPAPVEPVTPPAPVVKEAKAQAKAPATAPKKLKAQKEYLLAALDKAIEEAPEDSSVTKGPAANFRNVNPSILQGDPNSLTAYSEFFSNLNVRESIESHGFSGLDVPSKSIVLSHVIRAAKNREILDSIIKLVPIDVVNMLNSRQFTPDMAFHDESMLKLLFSAKGESPVSLGSDISNAIVRMIAVLSAKISSGSNLGGSSIKNDSTAGAGSLHAKESKPNGTDLSTDNTGDRTHYPRFIEVTVPGDGTFRIVNDKQTLRDFRKLANTRFPTTTGNAPQPTVTTARATAITKLETPQTNREFVEIAGMFVSSDEQRWVLMHVHSDGENVVGTNGQQIMVLKRKIAGTEESPIHLDPKTAKPVKFDEEDKYPGWKQVIPTEFSDEVEIDTAAVQKIAIQAKAMANDRGGNMMLFVWRDPSGKMGYTLESDGEGMFSAGEADPEVAEFRAILSVFKFLDGLKAMRMLGHEKAKMKFASGTVMLEAPGVQYVQGRMDGSNYEPPLHPMSEKATLARAEQEAADEAAAEAKKAASDAAEAARIAKIVTEETPTPNPTGFTRNQYEGKLFGFRNGDKSNGLLIDAARMAKFLGFSPEQSYRDLISNGVSESSAAYAVEIVNEGWKRPAPAPVVEEAAAKPAAITDPRNPVTGGNDENVIPDLPKFAAEAIAQAESARIIGDLNADVLGEGSRNITGGAEVARPDTVKKVREEAKKNGWAWEDVTEKARTQLGFNKDFVLEGSALHKLIELRRKEQAAAKEADARQDAYLAGKGESPRAPRLTLGKSVPGPFDSFAHGDIFLDQAGQRWVLEGGRGWTLYKEGETNQPNFREPHPTILNIDGANALRDALRRMKDAEETAADPEETPAEANERKHEESAAYRSYNLNKMFGPHFETQLESARNLWKTEKEWRYAGLIRLRETIATLLINSIAKPYQAHQIATDLIEGKPTIVDKILAHQPIKESELTAIGAYPSAITKMGYTRGDRAVYSHPKGPVKPAPKEPSGVTYKGFTIKKSGKNGFEIAENGNAFKYTPTLREAKAYVDQYVGDVTPKPPTVPQLLENYFRPGKEIPAYGGGTDTVISFQPESDGMPWSVTVKNSEDGRVRSHGTQPSNKELAKAWTGRETPTAPQPEAPAAEAPTGIQDFGEKILGARKDLWGKFKHAIEQDLPSDVADMAISKSFPEPDYEAAIAQGIPVDSLATYKAIRDSIPSKPRIGYKLDRWAQMVRGIHPLMQKLAKGENLSGEEITIIENLVRSGRVIGRINLYKDLGFPAFQKADEWEIVEGVSLFFEKGVKLEKPIKKTVGVLNGRFTDIDSAEEDRRGYIDVLDRVRSRIIAKMNAAPEAKSKAIEFTIYQDRLTKDVFIGKKAVNGVIRMKAGFPDGKSARQYIADNQAQLEEQWRGMGAKPDYRRQVNQPRQGPVRRDGDATPDQFQQAFGFRGVQFGNWVEDNRRQVDINEAFDAFMDLADALGIPPRAVSLDGSLGLAFGARGHAGAAAHYEPGEVVINLTKMSGPGSLAHEWFHAFDNYFARLDKTGETKAKPLDSFATTNSGAPKNMRPVVWEAFKNIRSVLDKGPFSERSKKLDDTKSKPYYQTTIEKAARAFERYTVDRLEGEEISNDYLVNIVKDFDPALPTADEMNAGIREAFDKLFGSLEVEITDRGTTLRTAPITAPEESFAKNQDLFRQAEQLVPEFGPAGADPKFANPGMSPRTRDGFDIARMIYDAQKQQRKDVDTHAKGREMLEKYPDEVERLLTENAYGRDTRPIADYEQHAINLLLERTASESIGDPAKMRKVYILATSNAINGTEQARAFRQRMDRFMTREERALAAINAAIFKPSKSIEQRARLMAPRDRDGFLNKEAQKRIDEVNAALMKERGLKLEQIGKNRALRGENSRLMAEVLKVRNLLEQDVIKMVQHGATIPDIQRRFGKETAAKAQAMVDKARADLGERIKEMLAQGMTREQIRERMGSELKSAPITAPSAMTPEAIDAMIEKMLVEDFGLPVTIAPKALPRIRKTKLEAPVETHPLSANWSRPEFFKGMESYKFDTKDRAGIMERVEIIRNLAGAVGKIDSLTTERKDQALKMLAQIDGILAKYGATSQTIFEAAKGIEEYGFDLNDIAQVAAVARTINALDADFVDKATEYLYFSMLSGLQTMFVNATAIVPAAWESTVGRGVETAINWFVKDPMAAQYGEGKYILRALGPAISRAKSNFIASMKAQHPMFDRDVNAMEIDWDKILGGGSHRMIGSIRGKKGDLLRIPMRLLTATDDFNRTLIACAEVGTFAYRMAKAQGMKDGSVEMDKFILGEVNTPGSLSYQMASQKASKAIFSNPLPGQRDPHTGKAVPVNDIGDVAGFLANKLTSAVTAEHENIFAKAAAAALRIAFFPFQRTPFNILRKGVRYTLNPISLFDIALGVTRNAKNAEGKWQWKIEGNDQFAMDRMNHRAELIERLGQQLQGAILMTALMATAAGEGDEDDQDKRLIITGSSPFLPTGRSEREAKMRNGIGPFRVSFRNKDGTERLGFGYGRIEPVATLLAATIDTLKSVKRAHRSGKDNYDAAAAALGGLVAQAQDKSFTKGISDFIGLASSVTAEPDLRENRKALQFLAARTAMVVPNFIKQPIRESDSNFRDRTDSFMGELMYQMVPAGQKPAKVDPYGSPVMKPGTPAGRMVDVLDSGTTPVNKADSMLMRWSDKHPDKAWFPNPIVSAKWTHRLTKTEKDMTTAQLVEFRETVGKRVKALMTIRPMNFANPTERDVEEMKSIHRKAREDAKKLLSIKFSATQSK